MDDFAQLTELMDCFQNFKAYRQFLAQIDPNVPCLPYIGLLLTDITFICEGINLSSYVYATTACSYTHFQVTFTKIDLQETLATSNQI